MKASRKKRGPCTRMVVTLPERGLSESILHVAAPLLEQLGPQPPPEEARRAIDDVAVLVFRPANAELSA